VLVHGSFSFGTLAFSEQRPLAAEFELHVVDRRGFGRSPDGSGPVDFEAEAPEIAALLDPPAHLLGHSYGAFVTLQHAVDFPEERGPLVVSGGLPSSRYLERVTANLETFEPGSLRQQVAAERDRAGQPAAESGPARTLSLSDLHLLRARVGQWHLQPAPGIAPLEPAVRRVYRRGARRYARAQAGGGDRAAAMHRWRKRVKELRYVAEALNRYRPPPRWQAAVSDVLPGVKRKRAKQPRSATFMRRLSRRADTLSELLGEEHDLVVLEARVRAELRGGRDGDKTLLKLIAKRRKRLRREALRRGKRLYRRSPKKLLRRMRTAYASQAAAAHAPPGAAFPGPTA